MLKSESYKKGIIKSTVLNIFIKCIAFFTTIVIAYYFGVTVETDLYFYLFSTITLFASFINGMDLAVIIPEGMLLEHTHGRLTAIKFYNTFAYLYLIIGMLLFFLLFFFSVPIYSLISAFKPNIFKQHNYLLIVSSALPLFLILSNYLTSILTTLKYFTAPLIANGIAYVSALTALIIFHKSAGIRAIVTGLLVGYIINVLLLFCFMYVKLNWQVAFSLNDLSKRIKKNLFSVQLGNLSTFAFNYGIIVLLSSLPAGIYSAYNYSMQIINIPIIFIVMQTSAVAGIKFNELAAKNLHAELNKIFQDSVGVLLFLIVPFCLITFLYADVIVNFLFLRGGFTNDSAEKVVLFLKCLIFLVPCLTINTFISRLMTADKKVSQSFYFQLGFNVILLLLLVIVSHYYAVYGFISIMLSAYYLYITIIGIFLFRWLMPFIAYKNVLRTLAVILLFNMPFIYVYYELFGTHQTVPILILLTFGYYMVIIIINHFFKINSSTHFHLSGILKMIMLKTK